MNVSEWCKNVSCWNKVSEIQISLSPALRVELLSKRTISSIRNDAAGQAAEDAVINATVEVVNLRRAGCWTRLNDWTRQYNSPLFGKEADLVRLASKGTWVPSDRQAATLMKVLQRLEQEGFRRH